MRLAEYLFDNPGGPPQPEHGDNTHMSPYDDDAPGESGLATRTEDPSEYGYGDPIAHLDGQPIHHLANGFTPETAIRYRHFFGFTESIDEKLSRQEVARFGTPASKRRLKKKSNREHSVQTLGEVLKKGKNVHSSGDTKAIDRLKNGKYPDRAEDGKGFCFHWADGRGICAFKLKADALRWAQDQPRDIVKFWYGEPVHNNGKFRVRVADHYRKEESFLAQQAAQQAAQQFVTEGRIDFHKLLSDDETRAGWRANIAMSIYDTKKESGESAHEWRQRCAERFLDILSMPTDESAPRITQFADLLQERVDRS